MDNDGRRVRAGDAATSVFRRGVSTQPARVAAGDGEAVNGRRDVAADADDPPAFLRIK
jgi:hypothetical protein